MGNTAVGVGIVGSHVHMSEPPAILRRHNQLIGTSADHTESEHQIEGASKMKKTIFALIAIVGIATTAATVDRGPKDLNDLEMAHVAVTANNTDIAYAHLALAFSEDTRIREFAETMIRDHTAVNEQVFALASKLGVTAQDNEVSRQLQKNARKIKDELSRLRGAEFDRRYAENEAAYHASVNRLVGETFIPNIENPEVKAAFKGALEIFLGHQRHAEMLDRQFGGTR